MTSPTLPYNSNRTYSPVTSPHYPFHTTVWLYLPVTSQWHHYPFQTTAIGLTPQWHHLTTPSIQQFDSVPQWHHYLIHTIQLCPPVTSQSHHYPFHSTAIPLIPQWHDDITITFIQQQYNSIPPVTSWHHYPFDTTAIQLYSPVTSCIIIQTTLSPSDIMHDDSSPSDIMITSHYPIRTTIRLSFNDWCTSDVT